MSGNEEKAILAGGCFWGMQDLIRKRPGVISTRVEITPGSLRMRSCMPQKQPPARMAFSTLLPMLMRS